VVRRGVGGGDASHEVSGGIATSRSGETFAPGPRRESLRNQGVSAAIS